MRRDGIAGCQAPCTRLAAALPAALVAKGRKEGEDLRYMEAEGGEHNERSWAARLGEVLKFLFPKR